MNIEYPAVNGRQSGHIRCDVVETNGGKKGLDPKVYGLMHGNS